MVLLAAACTQDLELSETESAARCNISICGQNSPVIKYFDVINLRIDRHPNQDDMVVLGLFKKDRLYRLLVQNSTLVGVDQHNVPVVRGHDLIGAQIIIQRLHEQFSLEILDLSTVEEVVPPENPVETYALQWGQVIANPVHVRTRPGSWVVPAPVIGEVGPVCRDAEWNFDGYEWEETRLMRPSHAVLFEGDNIDVELRTIAQGFQPQVFNIGCKANTLAKMRLTRHSQGTGASWQLVQTALKLLTADYCGTPDVFTKPGHPLTWRSVGGMPFYGAMERPEARWNENGVTCIDTPRVYDLTHVQSICGPIPKCSIDPYAPYAPFLPDELATSAVPPL